MKKNVKFCAYDCEAITIREVEEGINSKQFQPVAEMLEQLNAMDGKFVPRQCFKLLLVECVQLYIFRAVVKDYIELAEKEKEGDGGIFVDCIKKRIEERRGRLQEYNQQSFTKFADQKERLKLLLDQLGEFSKSRIQKQAQLIEENIRYCEPAGGCLHNIFEALQAHQGQMNSFQATLQIHEKERKQKQDSIRQLNDQLQAIHSSYLEQYKTLYRLLPQHEDPLEIDAVKDEHESQHIIKTLHDFIKENSLLAKNAHFYTGIKAKMIDFLMKINSPFNEQPNWIIESENDFEEELKRIHEKYARILNEVQQLRAKNEKLNKNIQDGELTTSQQMQELLQTYQLRQDQNKQLKEKVNVVGTENKRLIQINATLQAQFQESFLEKQKLQMKMNLCSAIANPNKMNFPKMGDQTASLIRSNQQLVNTINQIKQQLEQRQSLLAQKLKENEQLQQNRQKTQDVERELHVTHVIRQKQTSKLDPPSEIHEVLPIFANLSLTLRDPSLLNQLSLQLTQKRRFTSAELLYRYDPKNKTNVHEYIDSKANILLVAKTANQVVGAFCSRAIMPKTKGVGADSFLFSFKDYTLATFPLLEGKGAFEYNKDFIIFGKSDLRIEVGTLKLASNFGLESCHFQSREGKIGDFLRGAVKREAILQTYELYQLFGEGGQEMPVVEEEGQGMRETVDSTILQLQELQMEAQITRLTQELIGKKREIKALTFKLQQNEATMRSTNQQHQVEIVKLETAYKDKIEVLQQGMEAMKIKMERQASELAKMKEASDKVDLALKQSAESVANAKKKLEVYYTRFPCLQEKSNPTQQLAPMDQEGQKVQRPKQEVPDESTHLSKIQQLEDSNAKSVQIIRDLQQRIKSLQETISQLTFKHQQAVMQLNFKSSKLTDKSLENQQLSRKNYLLLQEKQGLTQRLQKVTAENESFGERMGQTRDFTSYFPNEILFNQPHNKQFLVETVECEEQETIQWTRLLYRWDPLNKTNFHQYIDGVPNLFLLLKLQNGRVLGCYSNHPFFPGCKGGSNAILMVANTQRVFFLKPGSKAIAYDEYYIIFGNSEVRLKSGEGVVFSNFGIANSYFENNHQTVDVLFGEGKEGKELPISGYEIYQLVFQP